MIKNIIWDFDGTLFDTYPAYVGTFLDALNDFGHQLPYERVNTLAHGSMDSCIEEICSIFNLDQVEFMDRFLVHNAVADPDCKPPFPGAREVCEWIIGNEGLNFIVTHHGKTNAESILAYHRMAHLFTDAIFRDQGYPKKPDPAMFNVLIDRYQLNRNETLAIGDRDLDIEAGLLAGLPTCLYAKDGDIPHKPDIVINDYRDFLIPTFNTFPSFS
jgi:phosphoglycolate phosphatase-like HAD superfamily hydrolase